MKQVRYTCPRCGLQLKLPLNQHHRCSRCGYFPMSLGAFKVTPRVTIALPPAPLSGPIPSSSGPLSPSSGPITPGEGLTQPSLVIPPPGGPPPSQGFRAWFYRQSKSKQLGMVLGTFFALVLVCACLGVASGAGGNTTTGTATPTSGQIAQHSAHPTATPTKTHQPTATPKPAETPTETPTATPTVTPTATQTPKPTATATPAPQPTATNTPAPSCPYQAVNGNPWCYNFQCCNTIYSPPSNFCAYFSCINNFWNGSGYVEECQDGMYSKSGGRSGSCSYHGGNLQPLLAP